MCYSISDPLDQLTHAAGQRLCEELTLCTNPSNGSPRWEPRQIAEEDYSTVERTHYASLFKIGIDLLRNLNQPL